MITAKLTKRTVVLDLEIETDETLPDSDRMSMSISPDRAKVTIEDGFVTDIEVTGQRIYLTPVSVSAARCGRSVWTTRESVAGLSMIGDVPRLIDEIHTAALETNWRAEQDDLADGEALGDQTVSLRNPA